MNEAENGSDTLRDKWACELGGLGKSWMRDLEAEIARQVNDITQELVNPERVMEFMRKSGIDFTGIAGRTNEESLDDPYRVLGLDRSASDEDIKSRYRRLMFILHPDTAGVEGTEGLLKSVIKAYEAIRKERGWS